jgi:phosphotriesterase-related protein
VASPIMTVTGPVDPWVLGMTLPHEHVLCDFCGAETAGPHRYDAQDVIRVMRPWLAEAAARGVSTIVDCSPAYLGRDVRVLRALSESSGVTILTNTGYYGAAQDKFLPAHAFSESAEALADRWVREWESGIDGTDIRPGFIKIGVDPAR